MAQKMSESEKKKEDWMNSRTKGKYGKGHIQNLFSPGFSRYRGIVRKSTVQDYSRSRDFIYVKPGDYS